MNTRAKSPEQASITAAEALGIAFDQAMVGVSWADDRIGPMLDAIIGLADYSTDDVGLASKRLTLIRKVAQEANILVEDMSGCYSNEASQLAEKLQLINGGAQ